MKTNIIVKLNIEGIHCWPQAAEFEPQVAFLASPHRHIFHIICKKEVSHSDRDVEIILFKRKIIDYLYEKYGESDKPTYNYSVCKFGAMSCEMIAEELFNEFELEYCSVMEDDENGAEVYDQPMRIVYKGDSYNA